ncbi:MAG: hypothetical protein H6599_08980 [Flavobacteriales bacterium]|nr:hypothetical protein [Flavobacteriales bacterium]
MANKTNPIRTVIQIALLGLFFSCASRKNGNNKQSGTLLTPQESFSVSLGHFVEKIDDSRLCSPMKMLVIFSIDTTGTVSDPDFKFSNFMIDSCFIDSSYIDDLKKDFIITIPNWKPNVLSDSLTKVRYSIPITMY